MSIEMTVSEIAEVLGLSRQAINNRVKELPEEDTKKNDKGVTVVTRSGLIKLEALTYPYRQLPPPIHEGPPTWDLHFHQFPVYQQELHKR